MGEAVKITADSTCDLSKELIEKYDIEIVSLYVERGLQSSRDGMDIQPDEVFAYFETTGELAKTSAVPVADYIEVFQKYRQQGREVVHINISGKMSVCHQNAVLAAQEVGGVQVVDSLNLSTAVGHLALLGAELARQGKSANEIADALNEARLRLDASFVVDDITYLHKGGRCSALAAFGVNLLHIKPSIKVTDGAMGVGKKYRGSIEKALSQYVTDTLKDRGDLNLKRIFITHTGCPQPVIDMVRNRIEACAKFDEILVTRAGCTITCHAGRNVLGILFFHQ